MKELERLRRLTHSKVPPAVKKLFKLSAKETSLAKFLENESRQGMLGKKESKIASKSLSGLEHLEGFRIPGSRAYGDNEE